MRPLVLKHNRKIPVIWLKNNWKIDESKIQGSFSPCLLFPILCSSLVVSYLRQKKVPTEEWDALHPWFLGCRRTVRFTHELQELWITSLDTWKCSTVVVWRLGVGRGLEGQEMMEQKTPEAVTMFFFKNEIKIWMSNIWRYLVTTIVVTLDVDFFLNTCVQSFLYLFVTCLQVHISNLSVKSDS